VSGFEHLHPALQHHIVNSLGWAEFRPLQEQSVDVVLEGNHCLLLAPTAGGKTEAAVLPLLSRMLDQNWQGLTVLYVCPLKALLNNLHERLDYYAKLVGRTCDVWHGDTKDSERNRLRKEPPDILLTTPESIEALLVSQKTDHHFIFRNLKAVVIDEIHAFAGDDRGWHLLCLLERLVALCGNEIQRIGLSATVGNPESLLSWMCGHCKGNRLIVAPEGKSIPADVQLDYVGSLENAAIVIARLYRGEKRLVFCDSRSRVEQLASLLRRDEISTFVSHSSLSADERRLSEAAFSDARDCVIVATSSLELGIDIGDLDHVIQIDAPGSVSSFLQRVGRSGRRKGTSRNCLFLATTPQSLLFAAALISLWRKGFVEPVLPPPSPYHVFVQQMFGLLLQEKQVTAKTCLDMVQRIPVFSPANQSTLMSIIQEMIGSGVLFDDHGLLWFGVSGEKRYGFMNFMNVMSIFTSPPLVAVWYGRKELGYVHESSFVKKGPVVLLLSGRAWSVRDMDWTKRVAHVEPTEQEGRSRWMGDGPDISFEMCQSVKNVIKSEEQDPCWSKRTRGAIEQARAEYAWVSSRELTIHHEDHGQSSLWTFAGRRANRVIADLIERKTGYSARAENLFVAVDGALSQEVIQSLNAHSIDSLPESGESSLMADKMEGVKFSECLPENIKRMVFFQRFNDRERAASILGHSWSDKGSGAEKSGFYN
jgi:ATP-dependent Lhr-like helicase